MKNILAIILITAATMCAGQAVSPLVVECGHKCSGSFTVTNSMVKPMAVVVEPYSFSLGPQSETLYRALDTTVELSLNDMTARVGPHDSHTFDYSMKCSKVPCLVALTTGMAVGHTADGIQIRVVVPHIIYACEKGHDCRKNVRAAAGLVK